MKTEFLHPDRLRKQIRLSPTTIAYIKEYMAMNELSNFSRTIEALALMSIRDARMLGVVAMLSSVIQQQMSRQFNRFAKLSVHAGIEAGAAKEAAMRIYWLLLLREMDEFAAGLNPHEISLSEFESRFAVDPKSPSGQTLITLLQKSRERFRARSVKELRRPIEELLDLIHDLERWAEAIEEQPITSEQLDPL